MIQVINNYIRMQQYKRPCHNYRREGVILKGAPSWKKQGSRWDKSKETWVQTMQPEAGQECWNNFRWTSTRYILVKWIHQGLMHPYECYKNELINWICK